MNDDKPEMEEILAGLVNACAMIRNILGREADGWKKALEVELASRGITKKHIDDLVESARRTEDAFYEKPKPV